MLFTKVMYYCLLCCDVANKTANYRLWNVNLIEMFFHQFYRQHGKQAFKEIATFF